MKLKYLIIEDEPLAAGMLHEHMSILRPSWELAGVTDTVSESVRLINSKQIDLIFMDIELADGNCFEIFRMSECRLPVIFTTAYNDYASQAFKTNSIDYLLKPITIKDLSEALEKFDASHFGTPTERNYAVIEKILHHRNKGCGRLLVSIGDDYKYVNAEEIAYFKAEDKYTVLRTFGGENYITELTLTCLEEKMGTEAFFRLSRNFPINIRTIGEIKRYFNGRLKVKFNIDTREEVIVSAARRDEFLKWLDGE